MKRIILVLLLLVSVSFPEEHPVFSQSNANAMENVTTYTFTTINSFNTSTSAFRLFMTANFNWFIPQNFNYSFKPDGIEGNSLYWDIPPLLPNESTEVSFTVKGVVGLPESIYVTTEPLSEWNGTCAFLATYNSSSSIFYIMDFLNETNRSQGVTAYYDEGDLVLTKLQRYGTFAVFSINGTKVTAVSNPITIRKLVQAYASAASPPTTQGNTSALFHALLDTEDLKQRSESECYNLTGMDRFPCTNRTSCMYACFSVPVCSGIGESGWGFMDTMMDYNQSVVDADAKLKIALASSEILSEEPSYSNAEIAFNDLVTLNRAETKVIFHPLFTTYNFCAPPDYGVGEQTSARRDVLDYIASTCLDGQIDEIVDEAVKVGPLLSRMPINQTIQSSVPANISNVTAPNKTHQVPNITIVNETTAPSQSSIDSVWWELPFVVFVVWVLLAAYLAYWKTRDL